MPTVHFYFIRHGQSVDNLKHIWAGQKDSPLSNHGMGQARALGSYFSDNSIHFSKILSSDLTRAKDTAHALIHGINAACTVELHQILREQCFGEAEGAAYTTRPTPGLTLKEHYAQGLYPPPHGNTAKFPGGESRDELAARAHKAVCEIILPLITQRPVNTESEESQDKEQVVNVAVVSHGMTIKQLVRALLQCATNPDKNQVNGLARKFLHNTGWACVVVSSQSHALGLSIRLTHFNSRQHLEGLPVQKGGIGSLAHDKTQTDIRAFFGGQTSTSEPSTKRQRIQPTEEIQREGGA